MHSAAQIDPVSILQECFRLGVPLCHLYNQNNPQLPLEIESVQHGVYGKTSKKALYHFITSCKEVLGLHDQTLGITDLYKDDTSGFVKVL